MNWKPLIRWNGLSALHRQVAQLDRFITKEKREKEEDENTVLTEDGKVTFALKVNEFLEFIS